MTAKPCKVLGFRTPTTHDSLTKAGYWEKKIGLYTEPIVDHHQVDALIAQAVDFMRDRGAEIVEIEKIVPGNVGRNSFQVMLFEFKDGLNKYFESLGPGAPVKNLEQLIDLTFSDSIEMQYFDHKLLKMAQEKGDLNSPDYLKSLSIVLEGARENGLDSVMDEHDLDAIIAPTGGPAWKTDLVNGDNFGVSSSGPAAWAGYPNITVPMGFIDGLPVGISFFGRAWSEPVLLGIAYDYEQGTMHRKAPVIR